MNILKILPLFAACLALAAAPALGFERNPGGDAASFSTWGLGARADALGRAYGPLADDAASIYWNPAGLAALERTEISFAYGAPFADVEDVSMGDAAAAKPLLYSMGEDAGGGGSLGTLAAAFAYRRAAGILEADEKGLTGRKFADLDFELYLAYAHTLGDNGAFGLTLKNVTREVGDHADSGFGLDLGGRFSPVKRLGVSAVLRNVIAPNFRLKYIKDAPPLTFELGAGYDVFGFARPAAVIEITREGFYDVGGGVELTPLKYVALRGGYYTGDERVRAGLGLRVGDFSFDYSMRFGDVLGDSHLASISFLVGGGPATGDTGIPEEEGYIEYDPDAEKTPEGETPGEEPEEPETPGIPGLEELLGGE
ncbi:MAG: hypothetical protein PVH29_09800 [Candidatus Zixiibacteriota bacterium]|jgi:hypothetical protein